LVELDQKVRELTEALGADKIGFADLSGYQNEFGITSALLERFPRAISIGVGLLDEVVETVGPSGPSPLYAHHYRQVNALLDRVALELAHFLTSKGHRVLPISASLTVDEERQLGHISHKAVAVLAGLGWMGKSTLVITPDRGPRVRFATVLTDAPLPPGELIECQCGPCRACVEACPVGAIRDVRFRLRPARREDALDVAACLSFLERQARDPRISELVCGICVKACPFGGQKGRGGRLPASVKYTRGGR